MKIIKRIFAAVLVGMILINEPSFTVLAEEIVENIEMLTEMEVSENLVETESETSEREMIAETQEIEVPDESAEVVEDTENENLEVEVSETMGTEELESSEVEETEGVETETLEAEETECAEIQDAAEDNTEIVYNDELEVLATFVAKAVSSNSSEKAYKLTETQLFMQAPMYLNKSGMATMETYLGRCVEYTEDALDDVSEMETFLASYMHSIQQGTSVLTKEIAAACGIGNDTYDDFKKEMAGELVKEFMSIESYINDHVAKSSKQFAEIERIYDFSSSLAKEKYITQLKKSCKSISDKQIEEAVDTLFKNSDKCMKYANGVIDAFDMITAIIELQDIELSIIDDLMIAVQDCYDSDLYEGLLLLRSDITDGIGNYILNNYLVEEATDYLAKMLTDAMSELTGFKEKFSVPTVCVAKLVLKAVALIYERFNPSVNDIVHTTVLYNYYKCYESAVNKYQAKFIGGSAQEYEIEQFKTAYKGELCAISLMMKYAKELADSKRLKNLLEMYKEPLGETVTCERYVELCLEEASEAITNGALVIEEDKTIHKTEDGTIIDESYDSTESIAARFNVIMGQYPIGTTWNGNWGGAIQCFGFARMVFSKLFGCEMPSRYYANARYKYTDNSNVNLVGQLAGSNVTANAAKSLLQQGKLGDIIQACGATYGQHTMVFVSADDTGVTVYDCNAHLSASEPDCVIHQWTINYDTWASWYGTSDGVSENGISLYRASNYAQVYGDGDGMFYDDSVNFVIENGVLTKYNGWQSFVEIPEGVTAIGANAFENNTTMMTVNIPDGVTSIGDSAFYGCSSLLGVMVPDSVENIGIDVFYNCYCLTQVHLPTNNAFTEIKTESFSGCNSLLEIEIPNSVIQIGGWAFYECDSLENVILSKNIERIGERAFARNVKLKKIEIPKSLESCGNGVFADCNNLKEVEFEKDTTKIVSLLFEGCTGIEQIEIPNTVTEIENGAFNGCKNLLEVKIPDSVTEIDGWAFYECDSLENVILSKNIERIGERAFARNVKLKKIEIPKSLESCGNGVFADCNNLKEVEFEKDTTKIVSLLFEGCTGIEQIEIPNTVTEIENGAFNGCKNLLEVKIPDSVTEIDGWAFYECDSLENVILSKNIERIGERAFARNVKLEKIEIPKSLESCGNGVFADCNNLKEVEFEKNTTKIVSLLFEGCTGIEQIEIPNTVTEIENGAFNGCKNLLEVKIPDSVTEIDGWAFYECSSLEKIEIPDSVISLGERAFADCDNLVDVRLSTGIKVIGESAFAENDKLTKIEIPKSLESCGSDIFADCNNLKEVEFEKNTTKIVGYLLYGCNSLVEVELPDTVTEIERSAFGKCSNLVTIKMPTSVAKIGEMAFYECNSLLKIEIPDSVTEIDESAFYGCNSLEEVYIPNSVTKMGTRTFYNCTSLKKVHLPEIRKNISSYMFYNCTSLSEINLPDTLTTVQSYAFYNCDSLAEIVLPENVSAIQEYAFYDCDALTKAVLPNSVTSLGTYAFYGCDELADVSLGTGLTTIPNYAFSDCGKLEDIVIPYNVTAINNYAFRNCTSLTEITIPQKTTTISSNAFSYPSKMTVYGVAGSYAETYAKAQGMKFVDQTVPAEQVVMMPKSCSVNRNATIQLVLDITPTNFTDLIKWKSSDTSIATVDANGLVKGVSLGTVTIKATVGDCSATCSVTVTQPVSSVYVSPATLTLDALDTYQLSVSVSPSNADNKELKWESNDENIATVSETGFVTALKKGTCRITATALDGSGKYDYCDVTVRNNAFIAESVADMESSHPYENNCKDVWVYSEPGASQLTVTFDTQTCMEDEFDYLYIYDGEGNQYGRFTGNELSGQTITLDGDTIKIQLISDDGSNEYGFKVTDITSGEVTKKYNISFDGNGYTSGSMENMEGCLIDEVYTLTENTFQRTGYNFVGWNTCADGSGIAYREKESIKNLSDINGATVILYAQWKLASVVEKPVASLISGSEVEAGTKVYLTTETNGTFIYYTTDTTVGMNVSKETGILYDDAIVIEENVTIYAIAVKQGYVDSEVLMVSYTVMDESLNWGDVTETDRAEFGFEDATDIPQDLWVSGISDCDYIGKAITYPDLHVYHHKTLLQEKSDYTVKYKNNTKAGTATVTITGKGNYAGSITKTFTIRPLDLSNAMIPDVTIPYNKKVQKETTTVTYLLNDKAVTLKKGTDFNYIYPGTDKKADDYDADAFKAAGTYTVYLAGKGNYYTDEANPVTFTVTIVDEPLISKMSLTKIPNQKYTGEEITPSVRLKHGGKTLTEGTDYEIVDYIDNIGVGTATIVIEGRGEYVGSRTATFKITGTALSKVKMSGFSKSLPWTGDEVKQEVSFMHGEKRLEKDVHYTVSYEKNIAVGKATVIYTGVEEYGYTGTVKKTFQITGLPISKAVVSGLTSTIAYDGGDNTQSGYTLSYVKVVDGVEQTIPLFEDIDGTGDYTVSYKNNSKAGTATITFTGINGYTGTLKKTYKIQAYNLADEAGRINVSEIPEQNYCKGGAMPKPEVVYTTTNGQRIVLTEGKDYTLKYSNHKAVADKTAKKAPTVTITGKGNFAGTKTQKFTILGSSLSATTMIANDVVYQKKANICKPSIALYDADGKKLAAGTDYSKTIIYTYAKDVEVTQVENKQTIYITRLQGEEVDKKDIIPVGAEITATVTGMKNYAGDGNAPSTQSATFRFVAANIAKAKVSVVAQNYTGKAIEPTKDDITVKVGKVTLEKTDYEIVGYSNNVKKGTAKVTIRGIGNYGGEKTVTFKINSKSMNYTISYDKNAEDATGTMKVSSLSAGKPLTANAYKRTGYKFVGWNTKVDGSGESYTNKEAFYLKGFMWIFGRNVTLYAQWEVK